MFDFLGPTLERVAFRRSIHTDCQVVRTRDFKLIARRTLDLSTNGMLVVADTEVELGEALVISFRAPRSDRWVDAEGKVSRVVPGRRRGDVARAVGLELECLDRASFMNLRASLRRLPPTRAKRPSPIDYAACTAAAARARDIRVTE